MWSPQPSVLTKVIKAFISYNIGLTLFIIKCSFLIDFEYLILLDILACCISRSQKVLRTYSLLIFCQPNILIKGYLNDVIFQLMKRCHFQILFERAVCGKTLISSFSVSYTCILNIRKKLLMSMIVYHIVNLTTCNW